MATNTGRNFRRGAVCDRSQVINPRNNTVVKRDTNTGRFIAAKSGAPYKGVAMEVDNRRHNGG